MNSRKTHEWHFFRMAGSVQPDFTAGADVEALDSLDQKHWMALSAPVKGVCFDGEALKVLDADADGKIRAPEVLAAIEWLKRRLSNFDAVLKPVGDFPLGALSESPEGAALKAVTKKDAATFSEADLEAGMAAFAEQAFNGDGVIAPQGIADEGARALLEAVIALQGGVADISGALGADLPMLEAAFARFDAWRAWVTAGADFSGLVPAAAAVEAVRGKVDDFFERLQLAAFDGALPLPERVADADPAVFMEGLPLAALNDAGGLPLEAGLNPAWQQRMVAFAQAAELVLKRKITVLSLADWAELLSGLDPVWLWLKGRPEVEAPVEAGVDSQANREVLVEAVKADLAMAGQRGAYLEWRKLLVLYRNLGDYLRSYVNFSLLYRPDPMPLFRIGTLYMDGRACSLCFHVESAAAGHSALAAAGKVCLAYCAITRPATNESRMICAAFTAGRADTLQVGRNGLFYDREGKDWEAVLVLLVDHPISLREAFWSPWRKIMMMLGEQIQKLLASRNEKALKGASDDIAATVSAEGGAAAPAAQAAANGAALASSIAVVGIAIGIIGSALGSLIGLFTSLPVWKTAAGMVAIILIVSLPSVALTWFKLRARDLSPILNACGWAMNRPLRLTLRLGREFTTEAHPPIQAVGKRKDDPYADPSLLKHVLIALLIVTAVLAAASLLLMLRAK